ncbi:MAG: polysaccharide pyruvyl transferase family protein [Bacteroidota bacterium]|nr:polysaccharide pyruvyl transferase family protein [Bacteroidota bacterium]
MSTKYSLKKIAIFGYFGAGNLGDEAVVGVLLKKIKKRHPNIEIVGICLDPENTTKHHGISAFPLRRLPKKNRTGVNDTSTSFFRRIARRMSVILPSELIFLVQSYKRLKGIDLVIVGGSGQLVDNEGGPLNHPYNHFKWSCLTRLVGAQFMFLSVGAGPLFTDLGKWFIKKSLLMASYRSFRDDYSKKLVEGFGVKENNIVCPDQAFSIDVDVKALEQKHKKIVVGVAPIAYLDPRHWPEIDPARYREYVEKMASFTEWLVKTNHHVLFFHTQVNGDDLVIPDIKKVLAKKSSINLEEDISEHPVQWFTDAFDAIAKTDYVVASRFHAIIFSYVMSRPSVGVSYDRKINNAMASVGQSDFALDIRSFTVDELIEKFIALKCQTDEAQEKIKTNVEQFRKQLEQQYDHVF